MISKDQDKIKDIITNVFSLLAIPADQFELDLKDELFTIQLNLPPEESGVFIGHQGDTLSSLQLLLALMINQRLGSWTRVKVNVGDYQQRREQLVIDRADQAIQRALETGQEIVGPGLNSYERHLVHEYLSSNPSISTESRGEEPNRQLFIFPTK